MRNTSTITMPERSVLQVARLGHRYGDRLALDDVSFDLPHGNMFALLGPNGSGKSTLIRAVTGVLHPTTGTVLVLGTDIRTHRREALSRMGVVFQEPGLDDKLTAEENLLCHGRLYGLRGPYLRRRTNELLDRFGLTPRRRQLVGQLSGGLRRRVELAKALIHAPALLVLDEPSTGLDPASRASLFGRLGNLRRNEGTTCLLTTHLMDEAELCDGVAILHEGKLVAMDSPSALRRRLGGEILKITSAHAAEVVRHLRERFGAEATMENGVVRCKHEDAHRLVPLIVEALSAKIDFVGVGRPTLADVFFHLTGHHLTENETARRQPAVVAPALDIAAVPGAAGDA